MADLLMLALVAASVAGAIGYVHVCRGLTRSDNPNREPAP